MPRRIDISRVWYEFEMINFVIAHFLKFLNFKRHITQFEMTQLKSYYVIYIHDWMCLSLVYLQASLYVQDSESCPGEFTDQVLLQGDTRTKLTHSPIHCSLQGKFHAA